MIIVSRIEIRENLEELGINVDIISQLTMILYR